MLFLIPIIIWSALAMFAVLISGFAVAFTLAGPRMRIALIVLLIALLASAANAQTPDVYTTTRKEPKSMFLAMTGVAIVTGGFVVIGQRDPCCCYAQPTPHQITGGVALVGVGVGKQLKQR